jgi:signal transduction histidine kinase
MRRFVISPSLGYLMTVLAVAVTLACGLFLSHFIGVGQFLLFFFPVLFSAWFFGRGHGFLATALSAAAIWYFFSSLLGSFSLSHPAASWTLILLFTAEGIIISLFAAAKKRQEEALERRVVERTQELESTNKQLQSAQIAASLGIAVAKIIHEIAQPLNALSTSLQLHERYLKNEHQNPDKHTASFMQDMREELTHLSEGLNELREFSRPFTINLLPVSLAATVTEGFDPEKLLSLTPKPIAIEHQFPEDLPPVMADSEKLRAVLVNLSKNAIEAMPEGGKLMLRGYRSGKDVCLEIEDTGVGVPAGVNIFEPFTTSKPSGWGLGLSIVRQIVSAHNGTIEYRSEPGRGTVFKICLPAAP